MRRRSTRIGTGAGASDDGAGANHDPQLAAVQVTAEVKAATRPARSRSSTGAAAGVTAARKRGRQQRQDEADEEEEQQEEEKESHKRVKTEPASSSAAAAAAAAAEPAASPAPSPPPGDDDADDVDGGDGGDDDEPDDAEAQAAAAGVSIYEWQRQQNIRAKLHAMQALNLHTMSSEIGIRRAPPVRSSSSKKVNKTPAVGVRRSARAIGAPPDRYVPELHTEASSGWTRPERTEGPIALADAVEGDADQADTAQYDAVLASLQSALRLSDEDTATKARQAVEKSYGQPRPISQSTVRMLGEGVKCIKARATVMNFHPTVSLSEPVSVLAVGDKNGLVSCVRFANDVSQSAWAATVQSAKYAPHVGSIVDLQWGGGQEGHALYSASRDGSVRRLDVEAKQFDEVWVADEDKGNGISAMCMSPDRSCVFIGDRDGNLHRVDTRVDTGASASSSRSRSSSKINLSTHALNGLSVNPMDSNMLASAGKDRMVRVWDLRHTKEALHAWAHGYSVNSVNFSPSGHMVRAHMLH